ncbi:MAG: hypothetical protein SFV51_18895 [Bryobacteraceae bacterium]|nr:hypothetical protein [Bryobacteraceae bacterium]
MNPIPINVAVEDELSEMALRRIVKDAGPHFHIGTCYGRGGFGYLRRTISGWNRAAKSVPFLVLTDLDRKPCPSALIEDWLPVPKHPNLLFRIAVRTIEAWLLADKDNLAAYLRIARKWIPDAPESLPDPKGALIEAARRSSSRDVRRSLIPRPGSTAKQGPDYNGCLTRFVVHAWNIEAAQPNAPSLARAVARLRDFSPQW